jgi:hypothetical protein
VTQLTLHREALHHAPKSGKVLHWCDWAKGRFPAGRPCRQPPPYPVNGITPFGGCERPPIWAVAALALRPLAPCAQRRERTCIGIRWCRCRNEADMPISLQRPTIRYLGNPPRHQKLCPTWRPPWANLALKPLWSLLQPPASPSEKPSACCTI